jgi:RNA polymerase sigma-32 factor
MDVLNERERDILTQRRLQDSPVTLEDLSGSTTSAANASARSRCAPSKKLQKRMRELAGREQGYAGLRLSRALRRPRAGSAGA